MLSSVKEPNVQNSIFIVRRRYDSKVQHTPGTGEQLAVQTKLARRQRVLNKHAINEVTLDFDVLGLKSAACYL